MYSGEECSVNFHPLCPASTRRTRQGEQATPNPRRNLKNRALWFGQTPEKTSTDPRSRSYMMFATIEFKDRIPQEGTPKNLVHGCNGDLIRLLVSQ